MRDGQCKFCNKGEKYKFVFWIPKWETFNADKSYREKEQIKKHAIHITVKMHNSDHDRATISIIIFTVYLTVIQINNNLVLHLNSPYFRCTLNYIHDRRNSTKQSVLFFFFYFLQKCTKFSIMEKSVKHKWDWLRTEIQSQR